MYRPLPRGVWADLIFQILTLFSKFWPYFWFEILKFFFEIENFFWNWRRPFFFWPYFWNRKFFLKLAATFFFFDLIFENLKFQKFWHAFFEIGDLFFFLTLFLKNLKFQKILTRQKSLTLFSKFWPYFPNSDLIFGLGPPWGGLKYFLFTI